MICSVAYTVLVAGLASRILAEPSHGPNQPLLARMSTRNIIGLHRRDIEGYAPMEQLCGAGDTCAEACGKGFMQCKSKDALTHCYNSSAKQACCPNGGGDSCDNGYFCTADDAQKTWCCPDGLSLKECAQKYNIPGPLTSQIVSTSTTTSTTTTKATATKDTSSEASHISTQEATTTNHASTKESTTTSTNIKKPESTEITTTLKTSHYQSTTNSEAEGTSTITNPPSPTTSLTDVSGASIATEAINAQATGSDSVPSLTPSASPTSSVSKGGSGSYGPRNGLMFFLAGALAALI
ncbi:hypothetical protein F5Y12DRAFT_758340 [Xylaria sp. FL1777]|nr:hypothetical protein F5Y12DRAFT_758340 [Xylaria sp. FL1777]